MAIARKGRRALKVGDVEFLWDVREEGGKPGRTWADSSYVGRRNHLRIVRSDGSWRLTFDGSHVLVEQDGRRVVIPPHIRGGAVRVAPVVFTPSFVRALIDEYHPAPRPPKPPPAGGGSTTGARPPRRRRS